MSPNYQTLYSTLTEFMTLCIPSDLHR